MFMSANRQSVRLRYFDFPIETENEEKKHFWQLHIPIRMICLVFANAFMHSFELTMFCTDKHIYTKWIENEPLFWIYSSVEISRFAAVVVDSVN